MQYRTDSVTNICPIQYRIVALALHCFKLFYANYLGLFYICWHGSMRGNKFLLRSENYTLLQWFRAARLASQLRDELHEPLATIWYYCQLTAHEHDGRWVCKPVKPSNIFGDLTVKSYTFQWSRRFSKIVRIVCYLVVLEYIRWMGPFLLPSCRFSFTVSGVSVSLKHDSSAVGEACAPIL